MMRLALTLAVVAIVVSMQTVSAASRRSAPHRLPDIRSVRTVNQDQGLEVNSEPFFPIFSWAQKTSSYPRLRGLGFNSYAGNVGADATEMCRAAGQAGGYAISNFGRGAIGDPRLLAWIHGDEPDMPRKNDQGIWTPGHQSPEELLEHYRMIKAADTSRPVFCTFTAHFMRQMRSRYDAEMQQKLYPALLKGIDVPGFDTYPIYGSGYASHLNYPAYGTEQLREYAGPQKPVYTFIETHKGSRWMTYEKQPDVLPKHTRFEVWGSIIRGTTGIAYFTHAWRPTFTDFAPTPEMQAEMRRINLQITRLTPAILAPRAEADISMSMKEGYECHFKATRTADGALWVFAQNADLGEDAESKGQFDPIDPRGGTAVFTVPGLTGGTVIEVIDENRTLRAAPNGTFTDTFGPLTEHIYRIAS